MQTNDEELEIDWTMVDVNLYSERNLKLFNEFCHNSALIQQEEIERGFPFELPRPLQKEENDK